MQDDILPPNNQKRPNTKISRNQPMRSQRLRGHSLDAARKRLFDKEKPSKKTPEKNEDKPANEAGGLFAPSTIAEPEKNGLHHRIKRHLNKRSKLELIGLGVFVLVVGGILIYLIIHYIHKPTEHLIIKKPPVKAAPKPTTVASPLSGLQVAPELAARPVTGIMVENSPDARPQSGLQDAGVVYEAIAEGGITRFLAVFQDTTPQYVGPVRSLRPYYIDFAAPYQASVAHVGGSPDALAQIRSGGSNRDIDQFFNADSYWRISSRYAPHNVYTSFEKLDALNSSKGFKESKYTPWKRKDEKVLATPTAAHIDIKISSQLYYSHYDYDKTTNTYMRSEGDKPHIQVISVDDKVGAQIHPKVVLALVMSYSVVDGDGHSGYGTTGSGQMFAFQDGGVTQGTWTKADRGSMFEFKDAAGAPLTLDTGQTWVTIVKSPSEVTSSP
jgi:hypothetical protein